MASAERDIYPATKENGASLLNLQTGDWRKWMQSDGVRS